MSSEYQLLSKVHGPYFLCFVTPSKWWGGSPYLPCVYTHTTWANLTASQLLRLTNPYYRYRCIRSLLFVLIWVVPIRRTTSEQIGDVLVNPIRYNVALSTTPTLQPLNFASEIYSVHKSTSFKETDPFNTCLRNLLDTLCTDSSFPSLLRVDSGFLHQSESRRQRDFLHIYPQDASYIDSTAYVCRKSA